MGSDTFSQGTVWVSSTRFTGGDAMLEKALLYLALLLAMAWLICISLVSTDEAFAADKIPLSG
jgi:hypothetical protein